jgi:hypothetical protein
MTEDQQVGTIQIVPSTWCNRWTLCDTAKSEEREGEIAENGSAWLDSGFISDSFIHGSGEHRRRAEQH